MLTDTLLSAGAVLLLDALFSWFIVLVLAPRWDERKDYGFSGKRWWLPMSIAAAVSVVFTAVLAWFSLSAVFGDVVFGVLSFFLVAASCTDAKRNLIPKELSNMALIVGAVACLLGFATAQYFIPDSLFAGSQMDQFVAQVTGLGIYMLVIALLFVLLMFVPFIGFGDIKMFWVTGLFLGSFLAMAQMFVVFEGMFVVMTFQLLFKMVKEKRWKLTGGLPALPAFTAALVVVPLATVFASSVTY